MRNRTASYGTGDKVHYVPLLRTTIHRWAVMPLGTDAGGATLKGDIIRSDGARGDGDAGEITIPAADNQYNLTFDQSAPLPITVEADDIVIYEVTAEGVTSLEAVLVVEYSYEPGVHGARLSETGAVETA